MFARISSLRGCRQYVPGGCKVAIARRFSTDVDDDEFQYPVQLVNSKSSQFIWDRDEIEEFADLSPQLFEPEKKIVYSAPNMKILKTVHRQHGIMGFSIMKTQWNVWKICNISIFGNNECENERALIQKDIVAAFNDQHGDVSFQSRPYQLVSFPNSWSAYDNLSTQIKEHDDGDMFQLTIENPVQVVLSSDAVVQFTFGMALIDSSGRHKGQYDMLATVNSAFPESHPVLCSLFLNKK